MLLSVDIGNFSIKTCQKDTFISKISEIPSFDEKNKITIDDKSFYIGDGEFSTDWDKSRKENTIELLFSTLAHYEDNFFKLVVGLPIQQYKANKEELKARIEANMFKHIEFEGKERDILITDILIAPESAAAYYNLTAEQKAKIGTKQLIIVDIGGRTTDICLFQNKKILDVKTTPVGMLNIYQDIVNEVNSKYTQEFKLEDGEEILRDGLMINGEMKDVSFIKPILQRHFNSIYKELQLHFNVSKGYILLTGGGSIVLRKAFENRLNNVIMSNEPIFDNALGFYKLGLNLWGGK